MAPPRPVFHVGGITGFRSTYVVHDRASIQQLRTMAEEEGHRKVAPPAAKVMSHFPESPSTPAPPKSMLGLTCFFDFVSGGPTHTFPTLMLGDRGGKNETLLLMIVVGLENEHNQQKSIKSDSDFPERIHELSVCQRNEDCWRLWRFASSLQLSQDFHGL